MLKGEFGASRASVDTLPYKFRYRCDSKERTNAKPFGYSKIVIKN
jgi:hypothetical protein